MNANELKLRNRVLLNGRIVTISQIGMDFIGIQKGVITDSHSHRVDSSVVKIDLIEPINLTDDLLIKCGFLLSQDNHRADINFGSQSKWIYLHKTKSVDDIFWFHETVILKFIILDFLHQLQNMYFYITGEELDLDI